MPPKKTFTQSKSRIASPTRQPLPSKRATYYFYGFIFIAIAGIFFSIPKLRFWESNDEGTIYRGSPSLNQQVFIPPKPIRPPVPEGVPKLTISISRVDEESYEVADDGTFLLTQEASILRGRKSPIDFRNEHRQSFFEPRSLIDLAASVQKAVLSLYRFNLDHLQLLAIRDSVKQPGQKIMFTFAKPEERKSEEERDRNSNHQLFDTKYLATEREVHATKQLFAKIITTRKQRVLNFTFAYIISFLSSIGHTFVAPNGQNVNATALAIGTLDLQGYYDVVVVNSENENELKKAINDFDTNDGQMPENKPTIQIQSINPVMEQQDLLQFSDNRASIKHVWTTVSTFDGQKEHSFNFDLGCMQYDKITEGLEPVITDITDARNSSGYLTERYLIPEESLIDKGAKYFIALREQKTQELKNEILQDIELNVFAAASDMVIREWDNAWIKTLEEQQKNKRRK